MNRQEILEEITELKERLNKLEKMVDSSTLPNKRWRAKKDDEYYFIGTAGSINHDTENVVALDDLRYAIGNYFKTEEQAEFEVERLKVIAELREWATPISEFNCEDSRKKKYVIVNINKGENSYLAVDFFYTNQVCDLCFQSEEVAKSAIESVGEDRIIKYFFRRGENNERKSIKS